MTLSYYLRVTASNGVITENNKLKSKCKKAVQPN
jgi:hypothetical protein